MTVGQRTALEKVLETRLSGPEFAHKRVDFTMFKNMSARYMKLICFR